MADRIFEAKHEVDPRSEQLLAQKLGLTFVKEYTATDSYLKSSGSKALKVKLLPGGRAMVYEVFFDGQCFSISGREISKGEKEKLLKAHPIETVIHRRKRAYFWKGFNVKADFDSMKEFPGRLFLEIYSEDRGKVLKARECLEQKLGWKKFIAVPYHQL